MPAAPAHDGEADAAAAVVAAPVTPERAADGSLPIDKPTQHLLGLRTQPLSSLAVPVWHRLVAVVEAPPQAAWRLPAPEAARLEPAAPGWPLPGRRLRRGETVAWLRPVLGPRERAERRAQLAELEQKLVISGLTVERMRLQSSGAEDRASVGNVYYEQSRAEHEAMLAQRRLLLDSLDGRQALRATADGVITAVRAQPGEVLAAGQTVLELTPRGTLRLSAISDAPAPAAPLARLAARGLALAYRGAEPLADVPGARLLFELPEAAGLQPGQLVDIEWSEAAATALPASACVRDAGGGALVWEHVAPERFRPHPLAGCSAASAQAVAGPAARIVTEGAALLTQYR